MQKKIVRRTICTQAVSYSTRIHPLLARIYAARGVKELHEVEYGFDRLLGYEQLSGIQTATRLLAAAIQEQKNIIIIGDFDADGATATAVAVRALYAMGAKHVNFLVPNRFTEGYGLTPDLVHIAALQQPRPDILITVDNGIASCAGVLAAKEQGIQVIVTDHHLAPSDLPQADAIVNPNQPGDQFMSKALAGVGVIFYVMLALRCHLFKYHWFQWKQIIVPNLAHLLDLVALGTIADLVPLDQNNRILIQQGLRRIRAGQCVPGILALLALSQRDYTRIIAADLGFAVAARLNAAGRLEDMSLGIHCLLCDDLQLAHHQARRLDQLNCERRGIEKTMQIQAFNIIDALQTELQQSLPSGICLFDPSWHQGVIGILAARIKDRFHRPVIVFALAKQDELKGSARSIPAFHIRDALAQIAAQHPTWILKFGGHAMAAGLTLNRKYLPELTKEFNILVSQQLTEQELQHCLLSDGALRPEEFNLECAILLRKAGPFGQAFPEPLFDGVFKIIEQRLVGGKHLKLKLELIEQSKIIEAISFFVDETEWPNYRCCFVHAAYRLGVNHYQEKDQLQLIIEYLQPITREVSMCTESG